jgi:hypothetical protein
MWEFAAALGGMLLSALAMSRTPGPMLVAAIVILIDLIVVAYRVPGLFESQDTTNIAMTSIRVTLAPVALTMVISGYLGALSIQAFKLGFSPGQDWRTRLNPLMLQAAVVGSCVAALAIGVASWFGAIGAGFAQTNVIWRSYDPAVNNIEVLTARPKDVGPDDVKRAKDDGGKAEPFLNIHILSPGENDAENEPKVPVYPEGAKPITSTAGWEAYGKSEIEDAWEFAEDSTDAECFAEGQGRQGRCRDERCQMWSRVFVRACLTKAKKTPKYCDEVPDPTDEDAGTIWAQKLCAGREFTLCREILYGVQGHCHPPEVVAARAAAASLPSKSDGTPDAKPEATPGAKPAEKAATAPPAEAR